MKRTRIAAVALATAAAALATAAAALAPALGQPATAADGPYLQDPAGGEKAMKSQWTKDEMHKLEGQLRFYPGIRYKTVTRPGPSGASEYERQVADPKTLGWQPSFDFGWAVSDSQLVKKAVTTKDGRHPIVVHAVLRSADHAKAVEVRQELADRPATGRAKVEGGKRIACDTGAYTVEWSLTRSRYGTLTGTLSWDSSCEQYRTAFSTENGKV